jgi:23S rRNA (cytidine1920-2'-O)/16S rRNA (cytidine1409-2'-O)-methyltransferase
MPKTRLDVLLVERGLATSRTQAQGLIMAGKVSGQGRILDKPGVAIDSEVELHVKDVRPYVSRAGDKLESVATLLGLDFKGKTVLDVGSSTGGFTDYGLQHGATRVYCVDVGTNQLAHKLRQDERVIAMEKTDIREAMLPELVDMAVIDVSFISLTKVLEPVAALVNPGGVIVAMAKPQFEAGKAVADQFHGVISNEAVRQEILNDLREWASERFEVLGEADSAVHGAEGNIERFFVLKAR